MPDFPVSVIIRTRNSGVGLERCLNSIFNQIGVELEIIIVDSGSVDETLDISERFECKIIHYPIKEISFNYSKAINLGIQQAKGQEILIISSHVWLPNPNSLKWMKEQLNENDSIKAVSFARSNEQEKLNQEVIRPSGIRISKSEFKGEGMYNYCSLIRKSDWEKRPFREDLPTCEDQEWIWYWMKKDGNSSLIFQEPLAGYDNPNYNWAKDVQEYYTMGKYVFPYYDSLSFLINLYIKSFKFLLMKHLLKARHYFYLANTLLKYKIFPPASIQSDDYLRK